MEGKLVLLFFGYTSCPDACPTSMAELDSAIDKIGPEKTDLMKFVFVTVDPERDTPERVPEYSNHFNEDILNFLLQ